MYDVDTKDKNHGSILYIFILISSTEEVRSNKVLENNEPCFNKHGPICLAACVGNPVECEVQSGGRFLFAALQASLVRGWPR